MGLFGQETNEQSSLTIYFILVACTSVFTPHVHEVREADVTDDTLELELEICFKCHMSAGIPTWVLFKKQLLTAEQCLLEKMPNEKKKFLEPRKELQWLNVCYQVVRT